MVISKTPLRISFFGGGTDYPGWYTKYGGELFGAAIDHYSYCIVKDIKPFYSYNFRTCYSEINDVKNVDQIKHPSISACIKYLKLDQKKIEIIYSGDLPARTGLGSSSSFTVGLLNALNCYYNNEFSINELIKTAIHIEQNVLFENVGIQDQILTALGGMNHISISRNGNFKINKIILNEKIQKKLKRNCLLLSTGISRFASEIAKKQIDTFELKKYEHMKIMSLTKPGLTYLIDGDLKSFGSLLHEGWMIKRSLTDKISNPTIDGIYNLAIASGAIGGKLLGAGGGGFMLLIADPSKHKKIRDSLQDLKEVSFNYTDKGSRAIKIFS